MHHPDVWRPLQASPYRSYVQGPSGSDHCNLYVRLEHLTLDVAPLEEHLGFRIDVGHVNASARDKDYGYVQMISRDLSIRSKVLDFETDHMVEY